jgi:hypothetical protein
VVEFEVGTAIGAGLVGGIVMIVLLYGGIMMMPGQMRMNLLYMLGSMMGMRGGSAYIVGLGMHLMASIAFGIIHAAIFAAGDIEDGVLLWGAVFGLGHAVITGTMLTMMPVMHAEIQAGRLEAPGAFGISLGQPTAMGFVVLHVIFGAVVGVIYAA